MLRCSDAPERIAVLNAVKACAAFSVLFFSAPVAHAQYTAYYGSAATINTNLRYLAGERYAPNVVVGRLPGTPPGVNTDINVGTTSATAFAVNIVDGGETSYVPDGPYAGQGLVVFNRNTLNIQGGRIGFGAIAYDNSIINVSGGQGGSGYYGADPYFNINARNSSTINFNGATYCNIISAQDTATLNVSGGNSNGIRLAVYGNSSSTINVNANADIGIVSPSVNSLLNVYGGTVGIVGAYSTNPSKILGGTVSTLLVGNTGVADVFGGVVTSLRTGETGNGTSYTSVGNVRGGTVGSISNGDFSTVNIFGGTIGEVQTLENSVTNIYGGSISANTLYAKESGVVNLFGFGFSLSGMTTDGSGNNIYNLTGTLQDGTALSTRFVDYAGGNQIGGTNSPLRFNAPVAVPEAGTLTLLGFALVPVAVGLARRRK